MIGVMMRSEIIDDSIFDFAHELSAPLDFLIVHLLPLLLLRRVQLGLVDSVLLQHYGLHLRSLQLLLCCLPLSLLLFLPPYLLPLLHQPPLALFLRLHFRLLHYRLSFLLYRDRLHFRLNFGLYFGLNMLHLLLHLRRLLHFLPATHWRQDHRLFTH